MQLYNLFIMKILKRHLFISSILLLATMEVQIFAQETLTGAYACHDPSTIVQDGNRYLFFATGSGVPYHYSSDLRDWNYGGRIFPDSPPAWVSLAVQDYDPNNWAWAPDVAYFNGNYHAYYSVSEWGTIDSVIGLVTSPSLTSPAWTDRGKVVQSDADWEAVPETDTTTYNCIDPSILVDTNGSVWMTFGSYSSGILVTELDPSTGLRMNTNSLVATQVANNTGYRGWGSTIEAAYTYQHAGYYYLFVNYGGCCSGVDSTYNIRVGRSTSITGPYLDKHGVDMRDGGGTMLLESSGRFVGPGHAGIFSDGEKEWFSYHYYTWAPGAWSQLGLLQLTWDTNDWPTLSFDWSAFYPFNTDAREHSDWFDGSLENGAAIVTDQLLGDVLELDGTDDYVELHDAVANCSSIAAWVKWNGGNDWQRIFDFGSGTDNYMFLTPRAYETGMRFGIKTSSTEQNITIEDALPIDTWCHVAITLDGETGVMYLNGDPVATNAITIRPWEINSQSNFVGKSQFSADPYFNGQISSFRIFAHALSAEQVQDMAYTHPALAHRYSFISDVNDSIGMAHGRLEGSATISEETLSLPGTSGSYANLPGGLVSGCSAISIEFWADIGLNGNWARIFDFGDYSGTLGHNFLFFTPAMNTSQFRLDMNGTTIDISGGNLNNQLVHVVCIIDPESNYTALYIDGQLAQQQTASTPALDTISKAWSFLGRSLFSADPYLNADIDEFRIYDGRLSADEIAVNFVAGPDLIHQPSSLTWTNDGEHVSFAWPSFPAGYRLEYTTSLVTDTPWPPLPTPAPSNGGYSLTLPMNSISTSNAFFRLRR